MFAWQKSCSLTSLCRDEDSIGINKDYNWELHSVCAMESPEGKPGTTLLQTRSFTPRSWGAAYIHCKPHCCQHCGLLKLNRRYCKIIIIKVSLWNHFLLIPVCTNCNTMKLSCQWAETYRKCKLQCCIQVIRISKSPSKCRLSSALWTADLAV